MQIRGGPGYLQFALWVVTIALRKRQRWSLPLLVSTKGGGFFGLNSNKIMYVVTKLKNMNSYSIQPSLILGNNY